MPALQGQHALPGKSAPCPPASKYLNETERKVVLLWCPSGRGAPGSRTESRHPAEPPFSSEKLLVGVFRVQVAGPLPVALGSRRQPPPAAHRATRPHCASCCGLAPRQPRRPESPSRGAGRTMELGAGPADAPRPSREPAEQPALAAAELTRGPESSPTRR